ncbi:hypothetical protein [Arvimicrobium flavum]|uniref:hypothetical protein n=1 Tax=Arvimicrobium flavum TaxID=3393320 RepID=UPI00237AD204|nr:hypothetical protein [Mesorhizobium shangrilense]
MSTAQLAGLLGVTERRVNQLATEGITVRSSPGKYDAAASVQNYIAHVSARAEAKSAATTLETERARLAKEQADGQALKNQITRREVVPAAEVERAWVDLANQLRSGVLALPSRILQAIPHLQPDELAEIDREVRDVLRELADDTSAP